MVEIGKEFVRLEGCDDEVIYVRPADIKAIAWDKDDECSTIFVSLNSAKAKEFYVNETPGFIFDKCNKVLGR